MKKDKHTKKHNRRKFLTLAALAAGAKLAGQAPPQTAGSGEKVKMLTPDGKLVEVDKSALERATNRKKVSNRDILDWRENPKKDKKNG